MLCQLPFEIIDAIADVLPQHSVRSLSLVSTRLYAALFPRLHRTITFRARNEWALNIFDVHPFFRDHSGSRAGEILQHARQIRFSAPIHIARFHRCVYNSHFFLPASSHNRPTLGNPHESTAHQAFLNDLSYQVDQVFAGLETVSIRSFQYV
ncbi:hypothetical protein ASPFODRAFT_466316 [Aspergillus luchuensis CBS 106.47]|uniref:F-box domain-containing protein n=1 Tax=Aspergillus luchuensis (strain CBS 106.47) TaxID=1137211 RepID=A0A1M3T056_ASPLC|nr:hypothetical protein ASPFODRAFT_466316 [Aspergillus luchuensis CBS 106.47]